MEASEDHDDTLFPHNCVCRTWKRWTSLYCPYMHIYLCEDNSSFHLYSFCKKKLPEVVCCYLIGIWSSFLTTFFLNRTLITEKDAALWQINYSGDSSLVLDTIFLQHVGLLGPLGPLEPPNAMLELHLQFGCVMEQRP